MLYLDTYCPWHTINSNCSRKTWCLLHLWCFCSCFNGQLLYRTEKHVAHTIGLDSRLSMNLLTTYETTIDLQRNNKCAVLDCNFWSYLDLILLFKSLLYNLPKQINFIESIHSKLIFFAAKPNRHLCIKLLPGWLWHWVNPAD